MSIEPFIRYSKRTEGKATIASILLMVLVFAFIFAADVQYRSISASDVATTSVTVLNSPPVWVAGPYEDPGSHPNNPTNEGDTVTWKATAEDPNGTNDFFLLVCKTDADSDEDNLTLYDPDTSSPPECAGGPSNRWARSAATTDLTEATATYETTEGRVEDEVNEWYAFICDNDSINPRCNVADIQQEPVNPGDFADASEVSSPFYVNYRPSFTVFNSPDPTDPDDMATWTTVAANSNTYAGPDHELRLFVCRTDQFDNGALECDGGEANTYASSTLTASNPSVTYQVPVPKQNKSYDAYGFVVDNFGFAAPLDSNSAYSEDKMQGTNAELEVNNVAPEVEASSIFLINHTADTNDNLEVDQELDETHGFIVEFTTADDNSCVAPDDTSAEMDSVEVNVYRSGVGMVNCVTDGDYDANNCYPYAVEDSTYEATGGWSMVCSRVAGSCEDNEDRTQDWECTFPLWYIADPTDGADTTEVEFPSETWVASVVVTDIDSATSTLTEGTTGTDVQRFTAFALDETSIAFGELEPGQRNDPLDRPTPILATGNTGVDQALEGTPMCPGFDPGAPGFGCDDSYTASTVPEDTIPARFQRLAIGLTEGYATGDALADRTLGDTATPLELNVLKTTTVATPAQRTIGWGIEIPMEIIIAGNYQGENTFYGVSSNAGTWSE